MSQLLGPSWRTTASGLVLAALGVALLMFGRDTSPESKTIAVSMIVAGVGLVTARDQ